MEMPMQESRGGLPVASGIIGKRGFYIKRSGRF